MCEIEIAQEKSKQWRLWGPKRDWLVAPVESERTRHHLDGLRTGRPYVILTLQGRGLSVGRSDSQQKLRHFS